MKKEKIFKPLFKPEECIINIEVPKFKYPKQAIIIGGGWSKTEGIEKGLWEKIKDKFTCCINYDYKYFNNATFNSFVDAVFYLKEINNLKNLPLIIGKHHKLVENVRHPNTILLQVDDKNYTRNLDIGVYKSSLSGLFSLSLMIYLLNAGEIFLLGYDFGGNGMKDGKGKWITHSYQGDYQHSGTGRINAYKKHQKFGVYSEEKQCKIYNVSPNSKIETFEKISYSQFFNKLDNSVYNQIRLREKIKEKLKGKIL